MAGFFGILKASGTMLDSKLEPTDETTYVVKIKNVSSWLTANNVAADISVVGGPTPGLKVTPDDRFFGTLAPGECVTKEISILTERVEPQKVQLCYHLSFSASFERCEGESTEFEVIVD